MRIFMFTLIFLLVLPATGLAGTRVDQRAAALPAATISIRNAAGSVQIEGKPQKFVHVTGTLGKEAKKLEIRGEGSDIEIEVIVPRGTRVYEGSHLVITLPLGAAASAHTGSASVTVRGLTRSLVAKTASGAIGATTQGGVVDLKTASGNIKVFGRAARVNARTASGNITCSAMCRSVVAVSASGKVKVENAEGRCVAESSSGNVAVAGKSFLFATLESASGNLSFVGSLAANAQVLAKTLSGNVVVQVPEETSARFELSTLSGSLRSDLVRLGRGKKAAVVLGGASASVRASSFSGSVHLRKLVAR